MCYFTKKVLNKRFLPNRKNGWNPSVCTDERFRYVEVECGHCFECRKKKRREWRIRNYEQLKEAGTELAFYLGQLQAFANFSNLSATEMWNKIAERGNY